MNLVLGFLLVAIATVYVAWPFFGSDTDESEPEAPPVSPTDRLEQQKHEAYTAIKEAQFDQQMGKLSDADFQALTEKYRAQALAAIAALDARALAETNTSPGRIVYCATCGRKLPRKVNFCPSCGRAIKTDRTALEIAQTAARVGALAS